MTVYIAHQAFSGPFDSVEPVEDRGGLYAILTAPGREQRVHCLDQSANIRHALDLRLKEPAFASRSDLAFAVRYMPAVQLLERKRLVEEILQKITIEDQ